jgi:hypothetical protein
MRRDLHGENRHEVASSEDLAPGRRLTPRLDLALADPALASQPPAGTYSRLLTLCREAKEAITPNSRKIAVDFGQVDPSLGEVMVPVAEFYERCGPLILQTLQATETAMRAGLGPEVEDLSALGVVYLVGGSCELPVLARALRERFGKRVRRSPYPSGATAIGLAVAADREAGYVLSDRFSRHFGVWREAEDGQRIVFDPIFSKETRLPRAGEPALVVGRRYHPVHNVGRFPESGAAHRNNRARHDIPPGADPVSVPPPRRHRNLKTVRIQHDPAVASYMIEEVYRCDATVVEDYREPIHGYAKTFRVREPAGATQARSREGLRCLTVARESPHPA